MILVHAIVIATFSFTILLVFLAGAVLNIFYVLRFLNARQRVDHRRFNESSLNLTSEMELISAVGEIKLNGAEKQKRWAWERIQVRLFEIQQDAIKLQQIQESGSMLLASSTLILANALAARYSDGDEAQLDMYSERALARVWKAERFSWQMTNMLHQFPESSGFDRKMQTAELDYLFSSKAAQTALAENYVGLPY